MTPIEHRRTYKLPLGYKATFIWPNAYGGFDVEWVPRVPRIRKDRPRRKFYEAYKAVRKEFLQEVTAMTGTAIAIVDTDLKTIQESNIINPPVSH